MIQCAARIHRHRAICLFLMDLFFRFATSKSLFLVILETRGLILEMRVLILASRGLILQTRGPSFKISAMIVIFRTLRPRIPHPIFGWLYSLVAEVFRGWSPQVVKLLA